MLVSPLGDPREKGPWAPHGGVWLEFFMYSL